MYSYFSNSANRKIILVILKLQRDLYIHLSCMYIGFCLPHNLGVQMYTHDHIWLYPWLRVYWTYLYSRTAVKRLGEASRFLDDVSTCEARTRTDPIWPPTS
jgi:hypothetical protein